MIEQQLWKFLKRDIWVFIILFGTSMKGNSFIVSSLDPHFVQPVKEIISIDRPLLFSIPLVKNPVQIGSWSVLAPQSSSDIFNISLVNLTRQRIGQIFGLFQFHLLGQALLDCKFSRFNSLVLFGVDAVVTLARIHWQSSSGFVVVSSENLIGPLFFLELLNFSIGNQHWGLRFFAMSVVKRDSWVLTSIWLPHSGPASVDFEMVFERHIWGGFLKMRLRHSAHVGKLEGWVVSVHWLHVSFCSEVDVGQSTLGNSFSTHVHFLKVETYI